LTAKNDDVGETANVIRYYGGWADKIHGKVVDAGSTRLAVCPVEDNANGSIRCMNRSVFAAKSSHGTFLSPCFVFPLFINIYSS
jgi:hypothetical protein